PASPACIRLGGARPVTTVCRLYSRPATPYRPGTRGPRAPGGLCVFTPASPACIRLGGAQTAGQRGQAPLSHRAESWRFRDAASGGCDAHANRAGDAGAAQAAIAAGVLLQVLLVVVLGRVERTRLGDLGRDRAEAPLGQSGGVAV